MAEMVGGAFLAVVFEKLFEQFASPDLRKNSVTSKLKMLEEKLKKVRLYLDDAEDRQLFDEKVKEWLDDLKHVVFMADDLVEQIHNSNEEKISIRKSTARVIRSLYSCLARTVQGEIDLILTDLDGLYDRAHDLELKHIQTGTVQSRRSSPTIIAPLREECHVFGREAEKEEILKMLLSEENKILVLPIIGMGGLGKTTLAQLVYNDKQVEEHGFSLKAWVTVSTEFDFCRIMKEILHKVNPGTSCSSINDTNELQQLMQEAVRGEKFLFALDDVWEENYSNWDLLMSNFTAGDPRSRVIVTTRSRDVASRVKTGPIHELEVVQKDDCWSIFVHHAFNGDTDADPQLQAIGRRIVEKCKGHPLAIRSLGGLLRSERSPKKWENILRSDLGDWSRVMENGVLPSLWLSYRYLSSSVKQCFAYCSILPQDYEFDKKQMVRWWMAEGFIHSNGDGKSMEEVGEEYFDDLVSRSLFQRSSEDDDMYVVHDLVHDLAAFVYGKFCLIIGDGLKNVTTRTRHVTYSEEESFSLLTSFSASKHLRTLISIDHFYEIEHGDDFLKEMVLKARCLRVVSLSLDSSVLHHSVGDLTMLRYLDLSESEMEELPDSLCSLFHLQTLILSCCRNLTRLPTNLPGKLIKLRHLDTCDTGLTEMPPKMGRLKELRVLTDFVLGESDGSGCSTLKELGELHHLGGKLSISQLQNEDNVPNAHILRDKAEIKELHLSWQYYTINVILAVDVLDALQPHENLEKLTVYGYPGSSFPKWVGERSFSKMTYVELTGMCTSQCRFLPPLGQLPSLEKLRIEGFEWVEKIGNEFLYGSDTNSSITPFPSLKILSFRNMWRWKEWSFVGNENGFFPRLRSLQISECWELESIIIEDDFPEMQFTKLHRLSISSCPLLERRYQKDKGEHWHYISHIADIDIYGDTTRRLQQEENKRERCQNEDFASKNV